MDVLAADVRALARSLTLQDCLKWVPWYRVGQTWRCCAAVWLEGMAGQALAAGVRRG